MCGLVGVLTKQKYGLGYKDATIFKQMLFADVLRGNDATGVFGVNKYGNLKMAKAAVPSPVFMGRDGAKELLENRKNDLMVLIGHNRAATKGASDNDAFAHPFIEDNVCLVHNGTLLTHKELANTEVDSHAICHAINDQGYTEALPQVNGAFALIWYEADKKVVRFTRNSQRPLFMVETNNSIYLASELELVQWILSRNGEKIIASEEVSTKNVYTYNVDTQLLSCEAFPEKPAKKHFLPPTTYKKPHIPVQKYNRGGVGGSQPNLDWEASYSTGDSIEFQLVSLDAESYGWGVVGKTDTGDTVTTVVDDVVATHLLDLVDACVVTCKATVNVVYYSMKNGEHTYKYVVGDLEVTETTDFATVAHKDEVVWISDNGIQVKKNDLIEQGGCCTQCGSFIDIDTDEDIMFSHVKYKRGKIKTLICPDCLETFRESIPNYGKGMRYERKKNRNNSVQTGQYVSKIAEELTPIESIRSSISC